MSTDGSGELDLNRKRGFNTELPTRTKPRASISALLLSGPVLSSLIYFEAINETPSAFSDSAVREVPNARLPLVTTTPSSRGTKPGLLPALPPLPDRYKCRTGTPCHR